ncbi:MAG: HAMP domain-containing sensor histidine kinase [Candidatus Saccharibacteria bacterium]|nr:HAMP domain-containing sensor histidine kinase [Candidatus Saccharibacteria bacterium]
MLTPIATGGALAGTSAFFIAPHIDGLSTALITSIAWIIGSILGALIALPLIAKPMRDILTSLSFKNGEQTGEAVANTANPSHAKTGFATVLHALHCTDHIDSDMTTDSATPPEAHAALTALDRSPCSIVVLDANQRIIFASANAPVVTTPTGEQILALEFINTESLQDWLTTVSADSINATRQWQRIPTDDGIIDRHTFYDVSTSYERGAAGETILVLFDRSEKYLPEEEDLNFIAFAAHELRGPITVIRGYLDILEDELGGRLQGDEPQLFSRLVVSASRLSNYIDNILNVARFDRHHLKVRLKEDTVAGIYSLIADDMQLRAATQYRMLTVNIPNDLPTVAADRGSLSEVIGNLIDNAIKYSFEGGTVSVTAEQKGDFVEISVADNGVGMPPNVVANLFRKFYRSHRSREAVAGTGIGLYICRAFVESHGGTITARSEEHKGSVFSFTIPTYASVQDKLLEDGQLNQSLIRTSGGWIKNHAMYRN